VSKLEIERRFLFNNCNIYKLLRKNGISFVVSKMEQFYLVATKEETLRFRKENNQYIKNIKRGSGLVREEIENNISKQEFLDAKSINSGGIIKKSRVTFIIDSYKFELDIFKATLKGLSILEVEFSNLKDAQNFKIPTILKPFIIKEITKELIYTNGALSKSMKIPLRADSYISLEEIKKTQEIYKPKFNLYISEYESTSFALRTYIEKFFLTFQKCLTKFINTLDLNALLTAVESIEHLKYLLFSFKDYIKEKDLSNILFNINNFLLMSNNIIELNKSFKKLLEIKKHFDIDEQTDLLKDLIKVAQKLKVEKEQISKKIDIKYLDNLQNNLATIDIKQDLDKPFIYSKNLFVRSTIKKLKKVIKRGNSLELLHYYKILNTLLKFYSIKFKIKDYIYLKEYYKLHNTIKVVKKFNSLLLKVKIVKKTNQMAKNELKKFKKNKKSFKKIKKRLCNGN